MFTRTLLFTLIFTFFTSHTSDLKLFLSRLSALRPADNRMITLESNDGTCITIPSLDAYYSGLLNDMIHFCPINQIIPITNFNAQELTLLANVLNTINTSPLQNDAIISLRSTFTPGISVELTPTFLNLCRLDNFFDIPVLQKMLLHYIAYFPILPKEQAFRDREIIALICEKLQEASNCDDLCHNDHVGVKHLIGIIEDAQLEDKKRFLESRGEIKGPFFMGVSVGELVAHGLINTQYKPIFESNDIPFVQARVEYPPEIPLSIEGLICSAPSIPDIQQKKKLLSICDTGISHLPANSFQRVHSPEKLFVIYNKLVSIHPEAFAGLHTLTRLKVWNGSYDIFTHMPVGTLDHLKNLMSLELGDTSFNPLLLKYCSKLKKLLLCRNHLAELPARWPQACTALEKITIIKNDFQYIPPSFLDHFPLLQKLSLANNKIKHIHADIFKESKNLTFLNLYGNPIPQKEIKVLRNALPNVEIEF